MNAVDTNILIYLSDSREVIKRPIASSLVRSLSDGILLWQVACEYVAASRKLAAVGYTQDQAFSDIGVFRKTWSIVLPNVKVFAIAQDLMRRFSLSYWDSMLVAACVECGVGRLFTEDFSSYSNIDGVEIVNPFRTT